MWVWQIAPIGVTHKHSCEGKHRAAELQLAAAPRRTTDLLTAPSLTQLPTISSIYSPNSAPASEGLSEGSAQLLLSLRGCPQSTAVAALAGALGEIQNRRVPVWAEQRHQDPICSTFRVCPPWGGSGQLPPASAAPCPTVTHPFCSLLLLEPCPQPVPAPRCGFHCPTDWKPLAAPQPLSCHIHTQPALQRAAPIASAHSAPAVTGAVHRALLHLPQDTAVAEHLGMLRQHSVSVPVPSFQKGPRTLQWWRSSAGMGCSPQHLPGHCTCSRHSRPPGLSTALKTLSAEGNGMDDTPHQPHAEDGTYFHFQPHPAQHGS